MKVVHFMPPFSGGIASAVMALMQVPGLTHATPDEPSHTTDATHVHCHHALRWPEALALARRLGVPAIKTLHILQARQSRMRGLPPTSPTRSESLQLKAIREADHLTIATHAAKAMLLEDHPDLDPARVVVVPLGPTLPILPRPPVHAPSPVVAVTRFDQLKGTDLLIDVVTEALASTDLRFVIAGGLPDNPRAEARWRAAFPTDPRVTFAGWLAPLELAALYASARAFVTTSRLETCGIALMEAVAAGVPAVATDLAVHREVAPGATFVAPTAAAFVHALGHLPEPSAPAPARPAPAQSWLSFWRQTR